MEMPRDSSRLRTDHGLKYEISRILRPPRIGKNIDEQRAAGIATGRRTKKYAASIGRRSLRDDSELCADCLAHWRRELNASQRSVGRHRSGREGDAR